MDLKNQLNCYKKYNNKYLNNYPEKTLKQSQLRLNSGIKLNILPNINVKQLLKT